jgi:hypothetical protein
MLLNGNGRVLRGRLMSPYGQDIVSTSGEKPEKFNGV